MKRKMSIRPEGYPSEGVGFPNTFITSAGRRILSFALALAVLLGGVIWQSPLAPQARAAEQGEPRWLEEAAVHTLAEAARRDNLPYVRLNSDQYDGIRSGGVRALGSLQLQYDILSGRSVHARLYLPQAALGEGDVLLAGEVGAGEAHRVSSLFHRYFTNSLWTVSLSRQEAWEQPIRVAVLVELEDMRADRLALYTYDRAKNTYRRILEPNLRMDDAGKYIYFDTLQAGSILVSQGELNPREMPLPAVSLSTEPATGSRKSSGRRSRGGFGGGLVEGPDDNSGGTATPEPVAVTGVALNTQSLTLGMSGVDNSYQLIATVIPADADNPGVTWSSDDTAVATVDSAGLVRSVAPGSATVTVTTADGGFTDTCRVTVNLASAQTPVITSQPQGANVPLGGGISLGVSAAVGDGGALSYQWYENSVDSGSGGTAIPGATGDSYAPPTDTPGTIWYYAVVTNTAPEITGSTTASAASAAAAVKVEDLRLTYDANGGANPPVNSSYYAAGDTVTVADPGAMTGPGGMSFVGWSRTAPVSGEVLKPGDSLTITGDTTLYAVWSGDGTAAHPVVVEDYPGLDAIRGVLLDRNYILTADIDVGDDWIPIGGRAVATSTDDSDSFTGVFNGNGHTVTIRGVGNVPKGVYGYYMGVFGAVGRDGVVENLCVEGTISHTGTIVNGRKCVGGIAGYNNGGAIQNCISTVDVVSTGADPDNFGGGIVGRNYGGGRLLNCIAAGTVESKYTGGIAGDATQYTTVENCVALNPSVASNHSIQNIDVVGRVFHGVSTVYAHNYARRDMTVLHTPKSGTPTNKPLDIGADRPDGADCDPLPSARWWKTTMPMWDWDNVWQVEDGQLPTLR